MTDCERMTNEELIMLVASLPKPEWRNGEVNIDGDYIMGGFVDHTNGLYDAATKELKRRLDEAPR